MLGLEVPKVAILSAVETVSPQIHSTLELAKQLEYLAQAQAAGIVLGARVPIIIDDATGQTKT